jgi:hypothetical protein
MPDYRKHTQAAVQVAAGLALNVFPAIFIAVYARIAPIDSQGFLALSLTVGVYIAQLFNAFIVEGRLATPDADHDLCLPWWVVVFAIASAAPLILGPPVASHAVLMISSTGVMSGLLMSRTIGVVSGRWQLEALAATVLIVAGGVALVLAQHHNTHSVRVLAVGAILAVLSRTWPRTQVGGWGMPPDLRRSSWVTGETAVVGIPQPAITSIVLGTIGPAASVAFRVISTVSGALEPILSYGRYRLLAHGHRGELKIFAALFFLGLIAVAAAAFGGFGSLIFGPAWTYVGAAALLLAFGWKVLMLVSTVPFAALRKAGETALVFWIRSASTVIYLILSIGFLLIWHSNTAVFAAFVVAEAITAIVYHLAAVKGAPEYSVDFAFAGRSRGGDDNN